MGSHSMRLRMYLADVQSILVRIAVLELSQLAWTRGWKTPRRLQLLRQLCRKTLHLTMLCQTLCQTLRQTLCPARLTRALQANSRCKIAKLNLRLFYQRRRISMPNRVNQHRSWQQRRPVWASMRKVQRTSAQTNIDQHQLAAVISPRRQKARSPSRVALARA